MINVTKSSMPEFEEYMGEIKKLWDTKWLTNRGVIHRELEEKLKNYLGVENISLFTNGHLALETILEGLGLKGEVITTPFTFASTTQAIVRCGLTPVFCDINEDDFTIDPKKIESLITDRTCAILPVHVYGNICNIEKIQRIADKYGLKVVYDAAHAFGIKYRGKGIGNFGDASMFSFHATKVFNTIEGGAACYHDTNLGIKMDRLKNFGIVDEDHIAEIGGNAKMNEFQAAMGVCNLRHVNNEIEKRKHVVERYRERLENKRGIKLSPVQTDVVPNYSYFPVLFDEDVLGYNRDNIRDALKKQEINARKYFYPLTNEIPNYREHFKIQDTPIAYKVSRQVLTLPLYADLSLKDVDRICDIILSYHN